jgi:hypothetical protein
MKTRGALFNKLCKMLRLYIIHEWMKTLSSPSKLYRIFYLIKMRFMHKGIAERRSLEK